MKNRITLFATLLITCFIYSCSAPSYVPSYKEIHLNTYGCFISVFANNGEIYKGELIALDSGQVLVLNNEKKLIAPDTQSISHFTVQFAQHRKYGPVIPIMMAGSFLHGIYGYQTAAVNFVATGLLTITARNEFTYNSVQLEFSDLADFARFPQGLPANVQRNQIQ